jgi:cytoskeletal protein CcmA (bactofilin family)
VSGELSSTAAVYVDATAQVKADVAGASLHVAGRVEGTVRSEGRVELAPTAQVVGEVHAGTLVMQEGARVEGQLHMTTPSTPPTPPPPTPTPPRSPRPNPSGP